MGHGQNSVVVVEFWCGGGPVTAEVQQCQSDALDLDLDREMKSKFREGEISIETPERFAWSNQLVGFLLHFLLLGEAIANRGVVVIIYVLDGRTDGRKRFRSQHNSKR